MMTLIKLAAMSEKAKATISEIISALLIVLFMYVATSKLIDHDQFVYSLAQSPLIARFKTSISWMVPIVELTISLFLFIPQWRRSGLLLSVFLISIFTFYISYMLLFTPELPCSCGGIIQQLSWQGHLLFNILFTALAYIAFIFSKRSKVFIAINRLEAENPVKKEVGDFIIKVYSLLRL